MGTDCCTCQGVEPSLVNLAANSPLNLATVKKSVVLQSAPAVVSLANLYDGWQWCDNTNGSLRDITGDGCEWYESFPETCGNYNGSSGFNAGSHCCVCGGGHDNVCEDTTQGATDSFGDSCSWYARNLGFCGDFDDYDFDASSMCCSCSGGGPYNLQGQSPRPLTLVRDKVTPIVAARKATMLAAAPANLHNHNDGHS